MPHLSSENEKIFFLSPSSGGRMQTKPEVYAQCADEVKGLFRVRRKTDQILFNPCATHLLYHHACGTADSKKGLSSGVGGPQLHVRRTVSTPMHIEGTTTKKKVCDEAGMLAGLSIVTCFRAKFVTNPSEQYRREPLDCNCVPCSGKSTQVSYCRLPLGDTVETTLIHA